MKTGLVTSEMNEGGFKHCINELQKFQAGHRYTKKSLGSAGMIKR